MILALALSGCGQRGPLYLPDEGAAEPPPMERGALPADPEGMKMASPDEPAGSGEDTDEVFSSDFDSDDGPL